MEVRIFKLQSPKLKIEILNYGGIIKSIETPDKNNDFENVVLGYEDINLYKSNPNYLGSLIGRTAGRIYNGEFILNDKKYTLAKNNNSHHLHGESKDIIKFFGKFWIILMTESCFLIPAKTAKRATRARCR